MMYRKNLNPYALMINMNMFRIVAALAGLIGGLVIFFFPAGSAAHSPQAREYEAYPPFQSGTVPPRVMLVVGKSPTLYQPAYDNASDINGDGVPDIRYKPDEIDYDGYFDSYKCYAYKNGRFEPMGPAPDKKGNNGWSGDFLNYLTMSRMDMMRKALYGGMRSTDSETETVLERAAIPKSTRFWGVEYTSPDVDRYDIRDYTPLGLPASGKRHLFTSLPHGVTDKPWLRILTHQSQRIWEWKADDPSTPDDSHQTETMLSETHSPGHYAFVVRVKVADPDAGVESNCRQYPGGHYKPTGLLQQYGDHGRMYFGLLSGSYANPRSGGVVRKNIGAMADEIDPETGQFNASFIGIIQTLNRFRSGVAGNEETGNPIAEMMYEALRYFSCPDDGPTPSYGYGSGQSADKALGLPQADAWADPFTQSGAPVSCASSIMMVISDSNLSYDSDQLPGSAFAASGWSGAKKLGTGSLNVAGELKKLGFDAGEYYIGRSFARHDGTCTPKLVKDLSGVRGLCPESPGLEGSYYAGAVAHFGRNTDLRADLSGDQHVSTYVVALSSPMTGIDISVAGQKVSILPLAKQIEGNTCAENNANQTLTGFFAERLTQTEGVFHIRFGDPILEDDPKAGMIASYHYRVTGNTVAVTVESTAPPEKGIIHAGYVISGTTNDGIFLEVESRAHTDSQAFLCLLDTPPDVVSPGRPAGNITPLPETAHTRTFTAGSQPAAKILKSPLWYAALWGGTLDGETVDTNDDGTPDTYFDGTTPLVFETRLSRIFQGISQNNPASGTTSTVQAGSGEGSAMLLYAGFRPSVETPWGTVSWLGYLQGLWVDAWGNLREDTNQNGKLDALNTASDSIHAGNADKIIDYGSDGTFIRRYTHHYRYHPKNEFHDTCVPEPGAETCQQSCAWETIGADDIKPIFDAGKMLSRRSADSRNLFTFLDGNWTGKTESAGKTPGRVMNPSTDDPFDTHGEIISFSVENLERIRPFLGVQEDDAASYLHAGASTTEADRAKTLIHYIRGTEFPTTRPRILDDGTVWKLGDIVNSTPVSVSMPPDNYHLLYGDASFQAYRESQKHRETVIYVGANDGMLHAFTAWRHDADTQTCTRPAGTAEGLGDELWAYIPQALLPHLKFLADPDYGHCFYVDLKPKVFDAQISGQWRTLLIVGLNMGGKPIHITEKGCTRLFRPTYTCLDITAPRNPKVLWERSYDHLGMTTSIPAIVVTGKKKSGHTWSDGKWWVVFGSGPTGYDGTSDGRGYIFVVDLETGEPCQNGTQDWLFDTQSAQTVMNSPTALDKGLTYAVDAVYFGSSRVDRASGASLGGAVFKVSTHASEDPQTWTLSTLFETPGPITAPVSLATDHLGQAWVFFGTGHASPAIDPQNSTRHYFFGIKDPAWSTQGSLSPSIGTDRTVSMAELYNATGKQVLGEWDAWLQDSRGNKGWYYALGAGTDRPSERVISKASTLGGMVFFSTWTPSADICAPGGETALYALYYETGTAWSPSVVKDASDIKTDPYTGTSASPASVRIFSDTGAPPPSIGFYLGQGPGTTAFLQLSTGKLQRLELETAFSLKSAITGWRDNSR
ncbi:hypothetical protein LJC71_00040 [Desulfosarcina sp. OttesenSCG-928-A07]|nr:hypothetical protein [Desulfosarcina sp. OttesenSCG-928-A07]